ncbi:MAG: RHS repeat-associated core domain-containing protein [Pirellula sp.]|jgi:RHS repeat-associated protein|nr:RHS repeat-associated core domain-containing protein [Pirellula sp.]
MNIHPIATPASPSSASPIFDAICDPVESLTTTFTSPVVPTLATATITEVALGYHRNQQYSITAMTTSTGAVAERYAYPAYVQPTILNASSSPIGNQQSQIANRFTYTGREWDETLDLHHFRARWMSPLAGRFLGRDPIGYEDGWNLNAFEVGLTSTDPEGLSAHSCLTTRISFAPGVRDPDRSGEMEFSKLAKRIGSILKIADLGFYWNFQVDFDITHKNCLEDCSCGHPIPFRESKIELYGTVLVGFGVPVNPLVTVDGEMKISEGMKLSISEGMCKGSRSRRLCGHPQVEVEFKVCVGKKKWGLAAQACVGVKTNCGLFGKCEDDLSPTGKWSFSVYGSACLGSGSMRGELDLFVRDFDVLGIFG